MPRAARALRYLHGSRPEECPGSGFIGSGAELIRDDIPVSLQYAGPSGPGSAPRLSLRPRQLGREAGAGMLPAKPRSVSAAHPLRTHSQAVPPSRQRRVHVPVIIHADDFGETGDITEGICLGIEAGVVTSTSVMVNMPGTADALRRMPQLAQQASFGIHLNLCEGRPLTRGATLMDANGQFLRKRTLAAHALAGKLSLPQLEAEVTAQVGMLRDAGVRVSHLDGHKH